MRRPRPQHTGPAATSRPRPAWLALAALERRPIDICERYEHLKAVAESAMGCDALLDLCKMQTDVPVAYRPELSQNATRRG
jgi:hypothetical protein